MRSTRCCERPETRSMSNNTIYNVTVDFEKLFNYKQDGEVVEEFNDAVESDVIGPGQFQVSYGVIAQDQREASHRAVNLVEAKVGVSAVGPVNILDTQVV